MRSIAPVDLLNKSSVMTYSLNKEGQFTFLNRKAIRTFGCTNELDLLSKKYVDMRCDASRLGEVYLSQDFKTMKSRRKTEWMAIARYRDGEVKSFMGYKTPLFDENDTITGTLGEFVDITNNPLINLSSVMSLQRKYICDQSSQLTLEVIGSELTEQFTMRESEVIYYLIRGSTAKAIGKKLGLSNRTIEFYIENLKYKVNAQNKTELIESTIDLGMLNHIPKSILCHS